ncbi:MAG: hypothetical protein R2705_01410 [Ilumatobacteraceae bacterium]
MSERMTRLRERSSFVDHVMAGRQSGPGQRGPPVGRDRLLLLLLPLPAADGLRLGPRQGAGRKPRPADKVLDSAFTKLPVVGKEIQDNKGTLDGSGIALAVGLAGALWAAPRPSKRSSGRCTSCGTGPPSNTRASSSARPAPWR